MSRTVIFVGTHSSSTVDDLDWHGDVEFWCANEAFMALGEEQPFRIFQLHPREWREAERLFLNGGVLPEGVDHGCFGRSLKHLQRLRESIVPVYSQQLWDDIPASVVYPFEDVRQSVGIPLPPNGNRRLWATSTFGYMAALALHDHLTGDPISAIGMAGIELPIGTARERQWEWPNLAYYLGQFMGRGVDVLLPWHGTSLLSAPHYALGDHPQPRDPDHWWYGGDLGVQWDDEDGVFRLGKLEIESVVKSLV